MANEQQTSLDEDRFPVSVILAQEQVSVGRWQVPRWRVEGVIAGEAGWQGEAGGAELILDEENTQHTLWRSFEIRLYQDSSESYWLNLVSKQPSLFVICRDDPVDGGIVPQLVTANYDEAGAYMEADGTVMATPMPPEVYRWLEQYVMAHYQPVEGKKRKRERWFAQQPEEVLPPRGYFNRG